MEKEIYDIAVEGTTLKDIELYDSSKRVVVFDRTANYGTTYNKIEDLKHSPYIKDMKVSKSIESVDGTKLRFSIESLPFLLSYDDPVVRKFPSKITGERLEYINICDIFFITETLNRIPASKNDILKAKLSDDDRFYLFQSIKHCDLSIFRKKAQDKANPIYHALIDLGVLSQMDLKRLSRNFGSDIFIYPVYGTSEISESVALINSFKGTTYVLNNTLEWADDASESEYKYTFKCDLGILYAKELARQDLSLGECFVRVIFTEKQKFHGNFLAFLDLDQKRCVIEMENDRNKQDALVKIIGLDSSAEICNAGLQMLYFIKRCSPVEDHEIQRLAIFDKDILVDISYVTVYDINQFY